VSESAENHDATYDVGADSARQPGTLPGAHRGTAANITFCSGTFQGPILIFEVNVQ